MKFQKNLEAGKHVYSEKPMSVKYDQAKELLKLAKELLLIFW